MTEDTAAAAAATEQATPAPAETEPATPTEGQPTTEQATTENAEATTQETATEAETEAKKSQSRSERYRRKISAQAGVIERQETERQELLREVESLRKAKASDQPPNPSDFQGGEYDPAYIAKLSAHESLKAVSARLDEREKQDAQERQRQSVTRAQQKLDESAAKAREHLPDFDETLQTFREDGGEFAPHVREAILSSGEKGPLLAYHLAKDSDLTDRLNAMSPQEALLEIGELRAKSVLPQPKRQTQAPPPFRSPTGGAAPSKSIHELAKGDDMAAYVKARNEQDKARRG